MLPESGLGDTISQTTAKHAHVKLHPQAQSFAWQKQSLEGALCSALQHGRMMAENGLVDLPFGAQEGSGGLLAALAASSLRRLRSCTPACQRRFWCLIHAAGSSCLQCSQINALLQLPS